MRNLELHQTTKPRRVLERYIYTGAVRPGLGPFTAGRLLREGGAGAESDQSMQALNWRVNLWVGPRNVQQDKDDGVLWSHTPSGRRILILILIRAGFVQTLSARRDRVQLGVETFSDCCYCY